MENKSIKKKEVIINPVERKTNEEVDTTEDGDLVIGGEKENVGKKPNADQFEGVED